MQEFTRLLRAIADENRLRALLALEAGELCACQLVELLRLAPSTVSQHMNILRRAGLVSAEKRGRWMYYRRAENKSSPAAEEMVSFVRSSLEQEATARRDRARLAAILRRDPHEICRSRIRRAGSPAARSNPGRARERTPR